jgi:hypothetical protein
MVVFGAILIRRPCPTIFVCVVWPNFTLVGQTQQKGVSCFQEKETLFCQGGGVRAKKEGFFFVGWPLWGRGGFPNWLKLTQHNQKWSEPNFWHNFTI